MTAILPSGFVNVEHFMGYMSRILFLRFVKILVLLLTVNPIHVRNICHFIGRISRKVIADIT